MSPFLMFLITLGILQTSVLLTTIYLHRHLTHRGLDIHPALALVMHLELALFTGIMPREWVAVHRKHHQFSDKEGDPHSPYLYGMWNVLFGNFFYYRTATKDAAMVAKYAPDYRPDILDRLPFIKFGVLGGLAIFMLMFGWMWGFFAWGFHVIFYILLNSAINSICHMVGYRNYDNLATNLQSVAFLTGGEGLHNNHHQYPTSARFAHEAGEIDPAWPVICLLESIGLAKVKSLPKAKVA